MFKSRSGYSYLELPIASCTAPAAQTMAVKPMAATTKPRKKLSIMRGKELPAPSAGASFALAGFVKVCMLMLPATPLGYAVLVAGGNGYAEALKMLPVALGLLLVSKLVIDRGLLER